MQAVRHCLPVLLVFALVVPQEVLAGPGVYLLRFSDTPSLQPSFLYTDSEEPDAPAIPAIAWLERQGWKRVWPLLLSDQQRLLTFAGPLTQRYLRVATQDSYYIWTRRLQLDPHRFPILEITWGVDQFPQGAALDLYRGNDRALAILVFFGPEMRSPLLRPRVPRGLAFFWGETETVGATYTCVPARNGPANVRMQCNYPHVKYIALRRGSAGTVHTDRVNLVEVFRQQFPAYWQQHHRLPPIVAVSFEAGSNQTHSASVARLYAIAFKAQSVDESQIPRPAAATP